MGKKVKNKFSFFLVLLLSILSLTTKTEVKAEDDINRETAVNVVFEKDNLKAEPIQISPNGNPNKKAEALVLPGSNKVVKYQTQLPQTGERLQRGLILLGLIILLGVIIYLYKARISKKK